MKTLKGVFAAQLTPLNNDLSPDLPALVNHGKWLLANGCDGLAVLGTTGEANSFSVDERISIMEALANGGVDMAQVIPGTGCCAITDTVALSKRAVELGASGVLMLPPFYYKNVHDDGLFAAYSEVIERVGDERLRVYLYHFPQMASVPLSHDLIERLLKRYPDTVVGLKDSSGDFENMTAMVRRFPGFAVFSGWDHLLRDHLRAGGAGCITAVANIACNLSQTIYQNPNSAEASTAHQTLSAVRAAITSVPAIAGLKATMARATKTESWRNVRPPLINLTAEQESTLVGALDDAGWSLPGS